MLIYYNKKSRNALPWEKLYTHKKKASAWVPLDELEEPINENDASNEDS